MDLIIKIALYAPPILLAITLHEVAHGWAARYLGDPTAASLGRLSLNPIKHIDPIGTIAVPAILLISSGFMIGWAKAVPVNMQRLSNPKRDMAYVALAGPLSNLLMALVWAVIFKFTLIFSESVFQGFLLGFLLGMSSIGVFVNFLLMTLNLIPFPPLDGSKVLAAMLPNNISLNIYKLQRFGLMLFIGIVLLDFYFKVGVFYNLVIAPSLVFMDLMQQLFSIQQDRMLITLQTLTR